MYGQFQNYIQKHELVRPGCHILAAVSGGADSMVLLALLKKAGYSLTAAHCNFNLRPGECDLDQQLVVDFCTRNNIPCYTKSFDTKAVARNQQVSVEMAARALRYDWFEMLRQGVGAECVATGHHLNDNVETFFLNITRGSGLRGLTGMQPRQGFIVRPLLFATRTEIELFARRNNIPFRKDSSNDDCSIPRNRLRNNVIPQIEKINPSFVNTMERNMEIWNDWYHFSTRRLHELMDRRLTLIEHGFNLELNPDDDASTQRLMLFEVLSGLGFGGNQAAECLSTLGLQTGKTLQAGQYTVIRDRNTIVILENTGKTNPENLKINTVPFLVSNAFGFTIEQSEKDETQAYSSDKNTECVDFQKVTLPLILRPWQSGDRFYPLGMKGSKKVSDFLTNAKVNPADRKNQLVLADQNGIIWVVGMRLDSRYATTKKTTSFLILKRNFS